jgi:hypothetical protein
MYPLTLSQQPQVACVEVAFVDRVVGVLGHGFAVVLDCPPKVRHETIGIVDSFDSANVGTKEENRTAAEARLDVVNRVAERFPN